MKGRKPKLPAAQVAGSATACPKPPSWLPTHAKAEWKRAAPRLHELGLLAPDTQATLESYCVAVGMVRENQETIKVEGQIVGGKPHVAVKMILAAMREARLLAGELGLTPHRRGAVAEREPKGDGWEDDADLLA